MPTWLVAALLVVLATLAALGPAAAVRTEPPGGGAGRSRQAVDVTSQTQDLGTLGRDNLALLGSDRDGDNDIDRGFVRVSPDTALRVCGRAGHISLLPAASSNAL